MAYPVVSFVYPLKCAKKIIFLLTNPYFYDSIESIEMKREDILRIISESPLSIYLSDEEKREIIKRILSISKRESNPITQVKDDGRPQLQKESQNEP
jgi:hypothetical protein